MKKILLMAIVALISLNVNAQGNSSDGTIKLNCTIDVNLGKGYNHSQVFILNGQEFLFCHNSGTGLTSVWNLAQGGLPVLNQTWSKGWTNIDFYTYKGEVYFFHQKSGEGTARINKLSYDKIMTNVSMGDKVYEQKWSTGWTKTKFFVHNDIVYLFHYKKESGLARLNAATEGGSVGSKIYEKTWAKGYTSFSFAENDGSMYFLYQNKNDGNCRINKMNLQKLEAAASAGLLSPDLGTVVYTAKWSTGWTDIAFFNLNNKVYMFCHKTGTGLSRIQELNNDGTFGKYVYDATWSGGWSSFDIIYQSGKPSLFHQKKVTGQTKICELSL